MKNQLYFLFFLFIFTACQHTPNSNIKNPVIFIAGLGNEASLWEEEGFVKFIEKNSQLKYGGRLFFENGDKNNIKSTQSFKDKVDFFSISLSDSTGFIDSLSTELKYYIDFVLKKTKAKKVILVGYSMGGLVARNYLAQNPQNHKTQTLFTIATPHLGSYWANVAYAGKLLSPRLMRFLEKHTGIPIKSVAIRDLLKSNIGKEGFLNKLNKRIHPKDVKYFSILAETKLIRNQQIPSWAKSTLERFNINFSLASDGVCSLKSQNMQNIDFFQQEDIQVKKQTIEANHLTILKKHQSIWKVLSPLLNEL